MVLRHRDFRLLWLGQLVSQLGNQFNYIALAWMVLVATGSSAAMGGVLLAQVLPNALFGWFAGLAVDRFDRRHLMMACSALRGLLVLSLPLCFAAGHMPRWLIYAVTFAVSTFTLVFYASEKTVIFELVDEAQLTEANAYAEMTSQASGLVGPVLAGLLVAVLPSPVYALYVDVFGFAASTLALACMHWRPVAPPAASADVRHEALEGLRFLMSCRFLLVICLTATAVNFLVGPFAVIFPVLSERTFHAGAPGFGWLMGGLGGGMLVGSLCAQMLSRRLSDAVIVYGGMVVVGAAFAGMALAPWLGLAVVSAAVAGFVIAPGNAVILTLVQRVTPPALQGRVFATMFGVVNVAMPLGVALASFLLERVEPRALLLGIGALTATTSIVARVFLPPAPNASSVSPP
jgi:MFS family permease